MTTRGPEETRKAFVVWLDAAGAVDRIASLTMTTEIPLAHDQKAEAQLWDALDQRNGSISQGIGDLEDQLSRVASAVRFLLHGHWQQEEELLNSGAKISKECADRNLALQVMTDAVIDREFPDLAKHLAAVRTRAGS